jgi:hypothetical protein
LRSPSRFAAGRRTLSSTSSAVSDDSQPDFFSARPTVKPGVPFSTMNIDMPWRDSVAPSGVLAAMKYRSACTPLVMNIFVPLSTQCSPSALSLAVVRMPATSEPAPGSVMPTAVIVRPAITPGMYCASCAGLPAWCRCGLAMSVCTSTVMMKPPKVDCDSASANTRLVSASASAPPYALEYIRPNRPASPILRSTSRGVQPASSQACACGSTSRAMKRATCSRSCSCSGVM